MKGWELRALRFVISDFVFLEIVTVLSQRGGEQSAVRVGEDLKAYPYIEIIYTDRGGYEEAWEFFKKVREKDVSFIDCSIVTTMQSEHIKSLLTFDKHFQKLRRFYNRLVLQ